MMTSETLYKLTQHSFNFLYENIKTHIDKYIDPYADFKKILSENDPHYMVDTGLRIDPPSITFYEDKNVWESDSQCLEFYRAFESLAPKSASDPLILGYINHSYLHAFGVYRWFSRVDATESNIANHWFKTDGQNNRKWNTAGRLWWMGHMAIRIAELSEGRLGEKDIVSIFSETAEYYHISLDYEVLLNHKILAECLIMLKDNKMPVSQYREVLRTINREAGARLIDSFDQSELNSLVVLAYQSSQNTE